MGVAYPREGAQSTYHDCDVGDHSHNEDSVVSDIEFAEIVNDLEKQPNNTGERTTTVNTSQMLSTVRASTK